MKSSNWLRLALLPLVLVWFFFQGCGLLMDFVNALPLKSYTEEILQAAGASASVKTCGMHKGSRAGYCLVKATPEAMRALLDTAGFVREPDEPEGGGSPGTFGRKTKRPAGPSGPSCLERPDFGVPFHNRPHLGVTLHRVTKPLPPTSANIHLEWVHVSADGTLMCLNYDYPYG